MVHCECEIDEITYKFNFAQIIQLRIIDKIQTSMSSSTKKKGKGDVMNAKQLSQLFVEEKCHSLFPFLFFIKMSIYHFYLLFLPIAAMMSDLVHLMAIYNF